jgi:mono/diheme cytochrome c family protein
MKYLILFAISSIILFATCKMTPVEPDPLPTGATKIEATTQRENGDSQKGYTYLVTGNYISSGILLDVFKSVFGASPDDLKREGDNKGIPYNYNVVKSATGIKMVATTCLTCHAERVNGEIIVGLGKATTDNTNDGSQLVNFVDAVTLARYPKGSAEWLAYEPFSRATKAIAPYIITQAQGVSSADKIFAALAAFRKKEDLTWLATPQSEILKKVVPTDVPAWWIVKKKNALYYNGLGVGDLSKHLISALLLTVKDSSEAREIEKNAPDLWAYLRSIKAPKYPNAIDQTLAQKGKSLFDINCAKCHGKYDIDNNYPNYLIDLQAIGTDKALADEYFSNPYYNNWYNESWFAKIGNKSQLQPTKGYVAPPLDGIWVTAPYLHNGSVPTLDDLLKSSQRPKYFSRNFDNGFDFDPVKMGWKYKVETSKINAQTYDTSLDGYGNGGHTYGDKLTDEERKAVIEYLKTL